MNEAVVAFAFGVPNTLRSNRLIAKIAAEKAKSRGVPVYTQLDVLPLDPGIEVELIEEEYPKRVPFSGLREVRYDGPKPAASTRSGYALPNLISHVQREL